MRPVVRVHPDPPKKYLYIDYSDKNAFEKSIVIWLIQMFIKNTVEIEATQAT